MTTDTEKLITSRSIEEFFQDSVDGALSNQSLKADANTVYYLVKLLSTFARADAFYERTREGMTLKPLALMYAEALDSQSEQERNLALRRMGDVALFVSGLFSESLNHQVVDVDYYVSMGGGAYEYLSNNMRDTASGRTLSQVFEELSCKFQDFVDVLAEVCESRNMTSATDVLRAYEVWLRTGSKRAARQLRTLGIEPNIASASYARH